MRGSTPGRRQTLLVTVLLGAALVVTVFSVHAANPRALCSFHGFLHAGIVETMSFGELPPENPYFAGRTICYYWFFHAVGALIARTTGIDALHALEAVGLSGLFALVAASVSLGRHLFGSLWRGVFVAVLALVGGGPFGPLIAIGRWLERGGEFLPAQANAPVGAYALTATVGNVRYGPIFYFFFTQSSRAVALAMLLIAVWALARAHRRPDAAGYALVVAAAALCTALSPVIGIAGIGALGAAYLLRDGRAWVAGRGRDGRDDDSALSWRLMLCLAAGVLVVLPTYYHLFLVSQGGYALVLFSGTGLTLVLSVTVGAGPVLFLARPRARLAGLTAADGHLLDVVLRAGLLLLLASMCLELPSDNNCNFYYAAMTVLAVAAAGYDGALIRGRTGSRRWAQVLGVLFFALPIPFIAHAFTDRAPLGVDLSGGKINRAADVYPDMARMYSWIRAKTPADAILVIDPGRKVAVSGNMPELPAMTGRVLFVGIEGYMTDPYPSAGQRRLVASRLVSGEAVRPAVVEALRALGRPIFLLSDSGDERARSALGGRYGEPVFGAGSLSLYRWRAE